MKIRIKKAIKIAAGKYKGVIIAIRYRERPYSYLDIECELMANGKPERIKVGATAIISENSKLGQMLMRFGHVLKEDEEIDPDILIGKEIDCSVFIEVKEKGSFAKISIDSIRPGGLLGM